MLKFRHFFAIIIVFITPSQIKAQTQHYLTPKAAHVRLFFDIGQNLGSSIIAKDRTSVGFAPITRLGAYYNRHLSAKGYLGAALSFNWNSYSFKYSKSFESVSDTFFS